MNQMEIEEGVKAPVRTGFFITKKIAIISGIILAAIFTGSIIATYYGKPTSCSNGLFEKCENIACANPNYIQG